MKRFNCPRETTPFKSPTSTEQFNKISRSTGTPLRIQKIGKITVSMSGGLGSDRKM
ncbi:MAG: hypothetical protein KIH08_15930 [Candidatus Freyarchaeota archaeon]|nr:hypothetical protein [Candidatus Jordarchaeia archaeon]MBS7270493.1 hypothetical protein [Candidatus Jordarchaeia archaeon]MBS7278554.1 hypothetical protein [Candidatus Jordarchaeia archaeon]